MTCLLPKKVKKRILKICLTILESIVRRFSFIKLNNQKQKSVSKLKRIRSFVVEKCHTANFNLIRAPPPYQLFFVKN